ncbi:site-specific integrase [Actinoplanes philippinensis]|uniref:Site-specific recombinase XerD n=1 Tax=Actinoplanes philippinensis TaxID=35752 RepID=A0A1I2HET9_9ACTN|nr:site-specific integrase [Actinoplanes philippinensis]GIE81711.1 site-specific integrase [Actinoplanes philippinensis]SFF28119.1 Site-specific recombinase XerD [Actinoplanes philippinensis]
MRPNPNRGRVYRRCGCRDNTGKQIGAGCPKLASSRHGTWTFAVDRPNADNMRKTLRRGGFATKIQASEALSKVLECERAGVHLNDAETVAQYLTSWLDAKAPNLRTNTVLRYRAYINQDLIPAIGAVRLEQLTHEHVRQFISNQLTAGRGRVTLARCITTLSSALNDAVKQRRLSYSPARYAGLPRPARRNLTCWTTRQAEGFLRTCHRIDDPLADLFELMICTGMRKGEMLGLHWDDVDLDNRVLFVRHTLVSINNSRSMLSEPKTEGSRAWVALSQRAVEALRRQRQRKTTDPDGLVFTTKDRRPLRPQYVLDRFRQLTAEAALPRIRVHDLRHLAATIMLSAGVPIAMVSKTLRHKNLATTVDIYGHLTQEVAQAAVDATAAALDNVAKKAA